MRTLVLFDGQNLFRSAKDAWGPSYPYDHPSYDVELLAQRLVSLTPGRTLEEIRFYTGVYRKDQDWERHWFWNQQAGPSGNPRGIRLPRQGCEAG